MIDVRSIDVEQLVNFDIGKLHEDTTIWIASDAYGA